MYNSRFCGFITPGHPLIQYQLAEVSREPLSPFYSAQYPNEVGVALAVLGGFRYAGFPGMQPLERTIERRIGNCISLASVVCSVLRASGVSESRTFVALGHWPGFRLEPVHAWALVLPAAAKELWLIDASRRRCPSAYDIDGLFRSHRLIALFNDQRFLLDAEEKRNALGLEVPPAPYGQREG